MSKFLNRIFKRHNFKDKIVKIANRDMRLDSIYSQMYTQLYEMGYEYAWIMEHMFTSESQYIVVANGGKLWKFNVEFVSDTEIKLSEPVEVQMAFEEIESEDRIKRTRVYRDKDTKELKFVCIAGSTVLNRIGVIDSRALYDSLEKNFDEAFLTYYHKGVAWKFGEVRGVFRYNDLLFAYGVVDEDTKLGKYAEKRLKEDGWGISIGFRVLQDPIIHRFGEVEIPVYTDGKLIEVSILREEDAACYYTDVSSTRSNLMGLNREKAKEQLVDFIGEENEDVEALLNEADLRQREIEDENLITRQEQGETVIEEIVEETTIELDEEALSALADETIGALMSEIEAQNEIIRTLTEQLETFNGRISKLETEDEERLNEIIENQPAIKKGRVTVTYRPSGTSSDRQMEVDVVEDEKPEGVVDFKKLRELAKKNRENTLVKKA